ncbi:oxidase EvaA [Actinacidiphila yanglinensis]|uniref:Oxidase EvaA n=1 Tax=Actinacidiphila yanglinensis TaxID=310779 RepID=A0A1H6DZV3_9ACTN|nr:NDP-hexose 2,3-dehydratase family protein [Actinacidiphila yanglinensis]SEG90751.1 oxidase EvaA [Actinacidiphila yanglinensis]
MPSQSAITLGSATTLDPAAALLQPRVDAGVPERLARSAAATDGGVMRTDAFAAWFARRREAHPFRVERIPFDRLEGWSFDGRTGDLVHRSGRFFTVEGLHVSVDEGRRGAWHQPIIKQPEVGILGILVKEFDGVLHLLMQAKMEPGNVNLLQLSPTVQATRSNYTKVHRGVDVKYLDHFTRPGRGRVLVDVLQSEHGAWFLHKSNRNMIVEASGEVAVAEDFCWLTLGQIGRLLHLDNVVNMDARTVLACAPVAAALVDGPAATPAARPAPGPAVTAPSTAPVPPADGRSTRTTRYTQALRRSAEPAAGALHSDAELLSWFASERSRHDLVVRRMPLRELPGWHRREDVVEHADGLGFRVVAVAVAAASREVARWTQPLIEPNGTGVMAFVTRQIGGVAHVLVHARVEGGFLDTVELAPTVQHVPGEFVATEDPGGRPPFLDLVLAAPPDRVRYEAVHSEEGGRFLAAQSRYLLVEADEHDAPVQEPPGYRWVTPGQLSWLVRHGHYLNVQARTLLACLNALVGGQ